MLIVKGLKMSPDEKLGLVFVIVGSSLQYQHGIEEKGHKRSCF